MNETLIVGMTVIHSAMPQGQPHLRGPFRGSPENLRFEVKSITPERVTDEALSRRSLTTMNSNRCHFE